MITPDTVPASEDVADHYDDLHFWYMAIWGEHVHHGLWLTGWESMPTATRALTTNLAERLSIEHGDRVCDIGCGYGATGRLFASEYGASVTGVTLSGEQYAFACARNTLPDALEFHQMDFMSNDFEDKSFDVAISIESTEHFPDKEALFREIYRILAPGGRVGVYAWLTREDPAPWEVTRLLEPICREGRLPGVGSEKEYRGWLTESGFGEVTFEDYSRNVRRTWLLVILRMGKRLMWDRHAWVYLFSGARNVEFGKTVLRIWLAYWTGSMRYGLFVAQKPEDERGE